MSQWLRYLWVGLFSWIALPGTGAGQVATDGTVGPRVELGGPDFQIGAELGRRAGSNLFHSFERFSIGTGERATFSGPGEIRNVISRVTGGARSDIDGTFASTIPGADFYFLNPAGVLFGPNAQLELQGSFHVSTAEELRFADGAVFSATDPAASLLTIAPPEAFGFLGGTPGQIIVDGSTLEVEAAQEETLSFVAGAIRLRDGAIFASDVLLAAQHASGTVPLTRQGAPVARDGGVTLTAGNGGGAAIVSSGPQGGSIRIEGGEVTINRSNLFDSNPSDLDSEGGIAIGARSLTVLGQALKGGLTTAGSGLGRAGSILVIAPDVRVADGTISSGLVGQAAAGDVTIHAERVLLENGGTISAPVAFETGPGASGGTITIIAHEALAVRQGSRIFSDTFGQGDGGSVVIEAGRLEIVTGAGSPLFSTVSASTFGGGDAGSLTIQAGKIVVDNSFISAGVGTASTGRGGNIQLTADRIVLRNTGFVQASTLGSGAGGSVTIRAAEDLEITGGAVVGALTAGSGRGGTIAISTSRLQLDGGRINASTQGSRSAGSITIQADRLQVFDEGQVNSSTFAEGDGGNIRVRAQTVIVDARRPDTTLATGIVASAAATSGGAAGTIRVEADDIELANGGEISSVTRGRGPGGNLTVIAGTLRVDDAQIIATTEREAQETADAGSVTIRAETLEIRNRGLVSAGTIGPGDGGNLRVEARSLVIDGTQDVPSDRFTGIESAAKEGSTGRSGNIRVRAGLLEIANDAGIATSTLGPGEGGRLRVEAPVIRLRDNGNIVSSSFSPEPGAGDAGQVTVLARDQLTIENALIGTESRAAGGGQIELRVGELLLITNAGEISSSVFGGTTTTAGDITIDPRFIVLDRSSIIAQAAEGRGGNIRITVGNLIQSPDGLISASAGPAGIDGTIVISTPEVDVTGGLVVLDVALLDAASLLRERCDARRGARASSFTSVRRGLTSAPDQPLVSNYRLTEIGSLAREVDNPILELDPTIPRAGSTLSDSCR